MINGLSLSSIGIFWLIYIGLPLLAYGIGRLLIPLLRRLPPKKIILAILTTQLFFVLLPALINLGLLLYGEPFSKSQFLDSLFVFPYFVSFFVSEINALILIVQPFLFMFVVLSALVFGFHSLFVRWFLKSNFATAFKIGAINFALTLSLMILSNLLLHLFIPYANFW